MVPLNYIDWSSENPQDYIGLIAQMLIIKAAFAANIEVARESSKAVLSVTTYIDMVTVG